MVKSLEQLIGVILEEALLGHTDQVRFYTGMLVMELRAVNESVFAERVERLIVGDLGQAVVVDELMKFKLLEAKHMLAYKGQLLVPTDTVGVYIDLINQQEVRFT